MRTIPWTVHRHTPPLERLARLIPCARFVVDGGAHKGRTVERFLDAWPTARVLAYEPQPRLARKLAKRFAHNESVQVRQAALGSATGRLELNVLERPTCSSLLCPSGIREKHVGKSLELTERVEVDIVRLDAETADAPDILKLDLQGYELEALRGAQLLLPRVAAVLCEVSFTPLYQGQPLAWDLADWMATQGFRLEALYDPWTCPDGSMPSADALFLHD
ncbi:2-O-methyltransferase NoeI [Fundidesulfovibrio magnetotacticus]|uniref:2-O-methyltransferase NoeI n=1 Tax=Fundidesulfovibrio magnetotacticus TaxID=2730080 RepID=A0A6V8LUH3_9BACT|nr:FkbM family methyltransferase [Fundidesulfovibrio magnetotacticus]GFK96053.1 2-O-methyltransferase NoeI [Fundidesulfovibrio magnetotacticus]